MKNVSLREEQLRLSSDCQSFVTVADSLSDEQFSRRIDDKWSIAEVVQHLYLSARPVARLLTGPREVLLQWGKPDAPSRAYETLSSAYQQVLQTGVKAPEAFTPHIADMDVEKRVVMERFIRVYQTLVEAIDNWSDDELDGYLIPHPVLGKLTVREMIDFTSAHTQHHLRLLPKP